MGQKEQLILVVGDILARDEFLKKWSGTASWQWVNSISSDIVDAVLKVQSTWPQAVQGPARPIPTKQEIRNAIRDK